MKITIKDQKGDDQMDGGNDPSVLNYNRANLVRLLTDTAVFVALVAMLVTGCAMSVQKPGLTITSIALTLAGLGGLLVFLDLVVKFNSTKHSMLERLKSTGKITERFYNDEQNKLVTVEEANFYRATFEYTLMHIAVILIGMLVIQGGANNSTPITKILQTYMGFGIMIYSMWFASRMDAFKKKRLIEMLKQGKVSQSFFDRKIKTLIPHKSRK